MAESTNRLVYLGGKLRPVVSGTAWGLKGNDLIC